MYYFESTYFTLACFFFNMYQHIFFHYLQENLLLDEDQNLKLIDFGLCAKPKVNTFTCFHALLKKTL